MMAENSRFDYRTLLPMNGPETVEPAAKTGR